jgi:hypothetical protein
MKSQGLLHTCVMSTGLPCEKNQIHLLLCQYGDWADVKIWKGSAIGGAA